MKHDQQKGKVQTGEVDLLDESYLDRKNQKLRITAWLDGDIYDELKKRAQAGQGKGRYQTLMNNLLREALFFNSVEAKQFNSHVNKMASFIDKHPNIRAAVIRELDQRVLSRKYPEAHRTQSKTMARSTKKKV